MKILDMFVNKETILQSLENLPVQEPTDWSSPAVQKMAVAAGKTNMLRSLLKDTYSYFENCEVLNELNQNYDMDLTAESNELTRVESSLELRWRQLIENGVPPKTVLVELRAGVGGADAALFVADIFSMYENYCLQNKWKLEIAEDSVGSQGGFRFISFRVTGKGAWNFFSNENGVHRVQRVPPTETRGRVHTSTITVVVLPETEPQMVHLKESDIDFEAFRGTGNGGQSINTTDSAVRLKHRPTGIVVTCRAGKSQTQNRKTAMLVLATKIAQMEIEKVNGNIDAERRQQLGFGNRSERRRNYDFPEGIVVDYKNQWRTTQIVNFMSGDLADLSVSHHQAQIKKYLEEYAVPKQEKTVEKICG